MASTVVIGKLRYDVVSDSSKFEKGMRASRAELKRAEKAMKDSLSPLKKLRHEKMRLDSDYQKGIISQKVYLQGLKSISAQRKAMLAERMKSIRLAGVYNRILERTPRIMRPIVSSVYKVAGAWRLARKEKAAYARQRAGKGPPGNTLANLGGSLGSAFGFGGPGAGIGRLAGIGASAGIVGGIGASIGGIGILIKKSLEEFAEYETAVVDLQVLLGDKKAGSVMVGNLREIARETPLTTAALVKNAQTMLGYGLSAEGLESKLTRLGEVAGGDVERFNSLTRAFAQIQSAGKLMGQELLQLINAGFPIAEVAKQAGVSMKDFRKEMEAGAISADHVSKALISLTSEGGMMYGRLEEQAKTLRGHWTRMSGEASESFANVGEKFQDFGHTVIGGLGNLAKSFEIVMGSIAGLVDSTANDKSWFTLRGQINRTNEALVDWAKWWYGLENNGSESSSRSDWIEKESKRRLDGIKQARDIIQSEREKEEREDAARLATYESEYKKIEDDIDSIRKSDMSDREKHEKRLADIKMKYLRDEINWQQMARLKQLEKERYDFEKRKKRMDELKKKAEEVADAWEKKQLERIEKVRKAEEKQLDTFLKEYRDAFKGNSPGVKSEDAGADYKFLADRQAQARAWKAQQAGDKVREKQLGEINGRAERQAQQAKRAADLLEERLVIGGV